MNKNIKHIISRHGKGVIVIYQPYKTTLLGSILQLMNRKYTRFYKNVQDIILEHQCNRIVFSKWWNGLEKKALINIAEFHLRFETIHPFQDGNGRIGRFIILKQCIETDINPILINSDNVLGYRGVLAKHSVRDLSDS